MNIQMAHLKSTVPPPVLVVTKPTATPKMAPIKTNPTGKKITLYQQNQPTVVTSTNTQTIASVRKTNPVVANIDVEDDSEFTFVPADTAKLL